MSEEFKSVHSQLTTLIAMQVEQTAQLNALKDQFNQAKGVLGFIKWSIGISVAFGMFAVTFWDALHKIAGK